MTNNNNKVLFPHFATKEQKNEVASAFTELYNEKEKERKVNTFYNGLEFDRYTLILNDGTVKKYQGKKYVVNAIDRFKDKITTIKLGW